MNHWPGVNVEPSRISKRQFAPARPRVWSHRERYHSEPESTVTREPLAK